MKSWGAILLLGLALGLTGNPVAAQAADAYPQVETRVSPTSGTVGDRFHLVITATAPAAGKIEVLPLFDVQTSWTKLDESVQTGQDASQQKLTYGYTIVPFETGTFPVPQVALTYFPTPDTSSTVHSQAVPVQINSVLSGDGSASALRDVKPPSPMPVPAVVTWGLGGLILLLLAALGWWIWRRYSQRLRRFLGQHLSPTELALKNINELEAERLIEQKKTKELYTRLTDTVRSYLHEAFGVSAMDLTSNELLNVMDEKAEEQLPRDVEDYRRAMARLVELLNEGDMVKFARYMPEPSQCRRALQAGRDIVNFTRFRFLPEDPKTDAPGAGAAGVGMKAQRTRASRPMPSAMQAPRPPRDVSSPPPHPHQDLSEGGRE